MAQVIRSPKTYDVIVVGSGAGGGMAAKILTEGGMNVALLEAGPEVHPEKDFKMFVWPYELAHRGIGVGGRQAEDFGEFLAPNGSWDIQGEPYTSAPGSDFHWFRSRIVGGRTNHWGRIALRFAPIDFRSYTRDGLGSDWPISYDDIAPYYDKVEGVHRRVRNARECVERAGRRFLAAAEAALHREHRQEGVRQAQHHLHPVAAGDSDEVGERAIALSLLRAVRARMHDGVEFQLEPGADSAGDGDGQADDDHGRDGARSFDGAGRQGDRRFVHRQDDANREARQRARGGFGGERVRVGAIVAEFEVDIVPGWVGEFVGHGWALSDGFGRQRRRRIFPAARKHDAAQSRRHRRHAHVHAVVEVRPAE